jgi:hypothetical protein
MDIGAYFIVAGAQKADFLKDLNEAVAKAIEQGRGLEVFRKDFAAIVQKHGLTSEGSVIVLPFQISR